MGLIKITSDMSETERLAAYNSNMQYLKSEDELKIDSSSVADFIIEQGISGIWTYRKWNSGMYEAWFTNLEVETTDYTASGSVFTSQKLYSFTAPFNTLSTCVGTASSSHTYSWGAIWHSNQTINVKILAVSAGTSKGRVDLYITGTWK